jgi:hypothetical protein
VRPSTTMQQAPLRVGLMIGGNSVPRWVAFALDRLDGYPFAEIVGVVRDAQPRTAAMRTGRSRALYRVYSRLDARRFGAGVNPFDEVDLSDRLDRLPALDALPITQKSPLYEDAIGKLEQWRLDVLLRLGSGAISNAVLDCARYGVWSYPDDELDADRGAPPLFWAIYEGKRVSEAVLERRNGDPSAVDVIYRSFSATDPISLHRSRARNCWKSADFVARKLRDVQREGTLDALPGGDRSDSADAIDRAPTNRRMLRFGWRLTARLARQRTRRVLGRQQWFLAYRRREAGLPTGDSFRGATVIAPPRDRFYADPCLVDWNDSSYLFFESFHFAEKKGVVSCCRLEADGRCTPPELVLERPYHLSYPFVFFVGKEAFMLPETAATGGIELYRARSFPREWTLEAVLVSGVRAVDPTLIEHDGRYWLFANVAVEGASTNDELFLYSSRSLRGPWEPHPWNPVVSDVRRARPAGRPFIDDDGRLIRPSQDCSGNYGSAVVFSRIDELSEHYYSESPVGRLESSWRRSNIGTHTYTRSENWEAVDGRTWTWKLGPSGPKHGSRT